MIMMLLLSILYYLVKHVPRMEHSYQLVVYPIKRSEISHIKKHVKINAKCEVGPSV